MDFRIVLRDELRRRQQANRHYSLRTFARFLGLDHASLSQMLRARRRLTARSIGRLAGRLGCAPGAIGEYVAAANDAAILNFLSDRSFRPESRWLAIRLGLKLDEVNASLQRLLRARRLEMRSPTRWARVMPKDA